MGRKGEGSDGQIGNIKKAVNIGRKGSRDIVDEKKKMIESTKQSNGMPAETGFWKRT